LLNGTVLRVPRHSGTAVEVAFNRNGNPYYSSGGRRLGAPRRDNDVWTFPNPSIRESANIRSPWGAPTFIHNWDSIFRAGIMRRGPIEEIHV